MAHILLIDDDIDMAGMVEQWLVEQEHTVSKVHCGQDGLAALEKNRYDVVVLDWHMPDLHGIEVLRQFRQNNTSTPVIMLTGNSEIDAKEEGLDCGANDYLTKPFSLRELSARIRTALRAKPAQLQTFTALGTGNEHVLKMGDLQGTALAAKYEFLEVLGEGSWGMVFKAKHPLLDRLVAIKMMRAWQIDQASLARFQTEALAVSRLDHANIMRLHDFGVTENNRPYMVTEYIEGQNIDAMLDKFACAPPDVAVNIILQLCEALSHAHAAGIVHRDLKPANIMLKYDQHGAFIVKVLDFGLAKFLTHERMLAEKSEEPVSGSPLYMPPEIIQGASGDARSDIYATGCILFELLTGNPPITGETLDELIKNQIDAPPKTLQQARPDLPPMPVLQSILDGTLNKDPNRRFPNVQQLKSALLNALPTLAVRTS